MAARKLLLVRVRYANSGYVNMIFKIVTEEEIMNKKMSCQKKKTAPLGVTAADLRAVQRGSILNKS